MNGLENTTAVILAGGLGTRLREVVADRPKVMALVAGRPFLTHLLDQLADSGIRKTVLCTGYLAEIIRNELGALLNAAGQLSGGMVLVLNGDSYCRCNLAEFFSKLAESGAYAGMALTQVEDVARFGAVLTNDASLVESFIEKGGQTGPGWINAGIYLLPVDLVNTISPNRQVSLEYEVFPALMVKGLYGYHCPGLFIDIGIPEEYQRSQKLFSEQAKGKI